MLIAITIILLCIIVCVTVLCGMYMCICSENHIGIFDVFNYKRRINELEKTVKELSPKVKIF